MLSLIVLMFVLVAFVVIFALAIAGIFIFRKKPVQSSPRFDLENVIDVTPKDEQ